MVMFLTEIQNCFYLWITETFTLLCFDSLYFRIWFKSQYKPKDDSPNLHISVLNNRFWYKYE